MAQVLDSEDMLFHMLVVGGTGSGKTNAILYMIDLLFRKELDEGREDSLQPVSTTCMTSHFYKFMRDLSSKD